ncbi:MAG: type II toxin-antitoxin system HicB family antitoxin, partial [Spirochaetales bacterium]|nr:type II toxin-antitoxin system HicB family antitoxin [Spirochaetales bacterium]
VKTDEMRHEFSAIIERDQEWYIAYCPELPGANGQGATLEECKDSLKDAIRLILEDRLQDSLAGMPDDAIRDVVEID